MSCAHHTFLCTVANGKRQFSKIMSDIYDTDENNMKFKTELRLDSDIDSDFWVFGYGSLVWKVDFPFETKRAGYIKGFQRRFYQNSIDHRGTVENPGRVVTLVPTTDDENSVVYGMAYKIPKEKCKEVIEHLDYREKNGYERKVVAFYPLESVKVDESVQSIVIYVATKDNNSYAGHRNDLNDIANQIFEAHGPSGSNREYLFRLADSMRQLFPHHYDDHLFTLERILKERERKSFNG
ncbi:putative glutathione-specific gamma-glutamylcyclotransferase 2 [Contarinia nasturtii]|uniref:putative glutathione-specific gamma-glutamylcyclotransferase 2 n=1 Tax=Contarinia nasturtii TaxID=265458 RepID=UPI0012D3DFF4|nr:putative glutathione-specific gamma-glutamylcyclotransferase 2 [Contarinia nasturtii]